MAEEIQIDWFELRCILSALRDGEILTIEFQMDDTGMECEAVQADEQNGIRKDVRNGYGERSFDTAGEV